MSVWKSHWKKKRDILRCLLLFIFNSWKKTGVVNVIERVFVVRYVAIIFDLGRKEKFDPF